MIVKGHGSHRAVDLWLASLGAYPELHWGLTLRFGASLIADEERWERLWPRISRLIWLRQGFMPDWLREAMLGAIPPQDETRVRQLLMEFLSIRPGARTATARCSG